MRDGVGLIEREFFEFVQDGCIGDDCDIEGVGDGCRQDTRIRRVSVTIDYLSGTSFLLCYSYRRMFPLGLCQYLEDRYVFSLGPQSFSLAPFPQDAPTPVPLLLFTS